MEPLPIRAQAVVIAEFNAVVADLIRFVEGKSRSDAEAANLDRLRRRMSLLKQATGPGAVLALAAPVFIKYSEIILHPDQSTRERFFLGTDLRTQGPDLGRENDFVFDLAESVRGQYRRYTQTDRDYTHAQITTLLKCSIEHRLTTGEC